MSGGQKRKVGARCDDLSLEEMNEKRFKPSNDRKPDERGARSRTQEEPVGIQKKIRARTKELPREFQENVYFQKSSNV